jgi:hypothetical protein
MQEAEKLFEIVSDIWQSRIDDGDFHEAVLVGMSGYVLLRAQNTKDGEKLSAGALNLVHVAIELSQRSAGESGNELSCSFCGQREPDVKLAAGPDAHICNACVEKLSGVFNKK